LASCPRQRKTKRKDLNWNIGESFGRSRLGDYDALMDLLSSANIAR